MEIQILIEQSKQAAEEAKNDSDVFNYRSCTVGDVGDINEINFELNLITLPIIDKELGIVAYFLYYFDEEGNYDDYELMSSDEYWS